MDQSSTASIDASHNLSAPYPASSRILTGKVGGIFTTLTKTAFTDKLLVTIVQEGKLGQWFRVPLSSPSSDPSLSLDSISVSTALCDDATFKQEASLLPLSSLTPTTLLGGQSGGNSEREVFGSLIAAQIGSAMVRREINEERTLIVGLGLSLPPKEAERDWFYDIVELIMQLL